MVNNAKIILNFYIFYGHPNFLKIRDFDFVLIFDFLYSSGDDNRRNLSV